MLREEFYEEGIVGEVKNGVATILIDEKDSCEECSAKIFCKPNESRRQLSAKDNFGVVPGDKVRIAVKGKSVLAASSLLYGMPLVLILLGIFLGMNIFRENKELFSSLLGILLSAIYFLTVFVFSKNKKENNSLVSEIIFVSRKVD